MSFQTGGIVLGGDDLNNSLQWTDRFNFTPVAASSDRTLGGNLVVFEQGLAAGQPITLTATVDTGWFTFGMVTALKALADVAGATYVFDYHGEMYNVQFDKTGRAVQFTPLIPKTTYANDTDYFVGQMRLFTV